MENDLLGRRLLHLETGSRLHFGCGVLTGIEALALIMDKDLTVGIGIQITKVNGGGCFGRFAVAGISHMELCALHRSASHTVLLVDGQLRHFVVLEYQCLFIACIQTDGLDAIRIVIGQIIRCGNGLLGNLISARCDTLGNRAILAGSPICLIIVVNTFHSEDSTGNHGIGASGLNLLDGQQRLFQVLEDELLICARAEIDGLGRLLTDHIRNGNSFFSDLIAVHRDAGQFGNALGIGGNILMEAIMDALYLEGGVGNRLFGLFVQLQNLEVRQLLVGCGNGNRTASIHRLLIHMGDDGVQESGITCGSGNFHEGIHALSHIGNGDLAGAVSCLGTDDLTVLNDVEYCTGLGVITLILLDQLDLYLCVILESQGDFLLAIPVKLLLDLVSIIADGIALGSSHFRCGVAADGHSAPRHTCQRTTSAGGVSAGEVVVHTLDLDDSASQTTGGIIGIHLTDAAACGDDRGVGESHRNGLAAVAGQNYIFGTGIVDLISIGCVGFCYSIGTSFQRKDRGSAVGTGHDVLGEGAVRGFHMESCAGQTLGGIRCIDFLDDQFVLLLHDAQFTQHDRLDRIGRMMAGACASEGILIHLTVAPDTLIAKVEDILGSVTERRTIQLIVNVIIVGTFQHIVDCHQLFCGRDNRIGKHTFLIAPHDSLYPGIHVPGIASIPDGVHAKCFRLIRKDASGMCVVISHHDTDGRISNFLPVAPGLTDQGVAHTAAFFAAEADNAGTSYIVVHLMQGAFAKVVGFIGHAGHTEALQFDFIGVSCGCPYSRTRCCGKQSENTDQREQHGCHAGKETFSLFHDSFSPFI